MNVRTSRKVFGTFLFVVIATIVVVFLCNSCTSSKGGGVKIPVRGSLWGDGTTAVVTNGNAIVAGGTGSGGASLDVLGFPWKNVQWAADQIFVGRIEPKYQGTFGLVDPIPSWTIEELFPDAVLGSDGLYHAMLVNGFSISIEAPALQP